jgi:hypothetical protein
MRQFQQRHALRCALLWSNSGRPTRPLPSRQASGQPANPCAPGSPQLSRGPGVHRRGPRRRGPVHEPAGARPGPDRPIVTAPIPDAAMRGLAGRVGAPLPVGNEGAGTVVAAGRSAAAQALPGKVVAAAGGGMYSQVPAGQRRAVPGAPGRGDGDRGCSLVREPDDGPRHGRDHADGESQRAGAHSRGLQPRPDAQPSLHRAADSAREHRAQARPGSGAPSGWCRPRLQFDV